MCSQASYGPREGQNARLRRTQVGVVAPTFGFQPGSLSLSLSAGFRSGLKLVLPCFCLCVALERGLGLGYGLGFSSRDFDCGVLGVGHLVTLPSFSAGPEGPRTWADRDGLAGRVREGLRSCSHVIAVMCPANGGKLTWSVGGELWLVFVSMPTWSDTVSAKMCVFCDRLRREG